MTPCRRTGRGCPEGWRRRDLLGDGGGHDRIEGGDGDDGVDTQDGKHDVARRWCRACRHQGGRERRRGRIRGHPALTIGARCAIGRSAAPSRVGHARPASEASHRSVRAGPSDGGARGPARSESRHRSVPACGTVRWRGDGHGPERAFVHPMVPHRDRSATRTPAVTRTSRPIGAAGSACYPSAVPAPGVLMTSIIDAAAVPLHVRIGHRGPSRQDVRPDLGRHPRRHHGRGPAGPRRLRDGDDDRPRPGPGRDQHLAPTSTSRPSSATPSATSGTRAPTTASTT